MANEMVKVNLPIQRMYRAKHEDRNAITVGPGWAEVPAWVADEWAKPYPDQQPVPEPTPVNQDTLTEIELLKKKFEWLQTEVDKLRADIVDAFTDDTASANATHKQATKPATAPKAKK